MFASQVGHVHRCGTMIAPLCESGARPFGGAHPAAARPHSQGIRASASACRMAASVSVRSSNPMPETSSTISDRMA